MSDLEPDKLPGEAGTKEGETGPSESNPEAPSVEGRETGTDGDDDNG